MLNSTKKPRVPPVPRVSCHTVAKRVRCAIFRPVGYPCRTLVLVRRLMNNSSFQTLAFPTVSYDIFTVPINQVKYVYCDPFETSPTLSLYQDLNLQVAVSCHWL